jgi:hypothetical protein
MTETGSGPETLCILNIPQVMDKAGHSRQAV